MKIETEYTMERLTEMLQQKDIRPTAQRIAEMSQEEFSAIFRRSAIKRAKLAGLQRNALRIIEEATERRRSREDGGREG